MNNQNPKAEQLKLNPNNNLESQNEEEEIQTELQLPKFDNGNEYGPDQNQYLQMSHSMLVLKLLEAQQEIERLKSRTPGNDKLNGNASSSQSQTLVLESNTNNNDFSQLSAGPPSPICPTPPYEYITISSRMLFYVNPKFYIQSEVEPEQPNQGIILCFDPSEIDFELRQILHEHPPITHKIVRKKSRLERGSSVPSVDSYYGTEDLEKVGHASYFIPMLSPEERTALGWKSKYCFGKWKYENTSSYICSSQTNIFGKSNTSIRSYRKKNIEANNPKIINSYPNNKISAPDIDTENPTLFQLLRTLLPNCNCFSSQRNTQIQYRNYKIPSPRPSFWKRIWNQHKDNSITSGVITGGDLVASSQSSQNSNSILKPLPPPIMIPIFTGETPKVMWFFGTKPPEDHRILLNNLRPISSST